MAKCKALTGLAVKGLTSKHSICNVIFADPTVGRAARPSSAGTLLVQSSAHSRWYN